MNEAVLEQDYYFYCCKILIGKPGGKVCFDCKTLCCCRRKFFLNFKRNLACLNFCPPPYNRTVCSLADVDGQRFPLWLQ